MKSEARCSLSATLPVPTGEITTARAFSPSWASEAATGAGGGGGGGGTGRGGAAGGMAAGRAPGARGRGRSLRIKCGSKEAVAGPNCKSPGW
eukprot:7391827-Prymnesium_polylepis.2